MEPLSIELPESLRQYVEQRAAAAGLDSAAEFVRELIERDRNARVRLEELLLDAINDERQPVEVNEAFWEERQRELARRVTKRAPA
jgi:Arc/MetJ-type ribon-helix-helix transcriptional regulator